MDPENVILGCEDGRLFRVSTYLDLSPAPAQEILFSLKRLPKSPIVCIVPAPLAPDATVRSQQQFLVKTANNRIARLSLDSREVHLPVTGIYKSL